MSKTKFEYFIDYLEKGDTEGVRTQMEKEFLEKIICSSRRPIHIASENGYRDIVKLLIDEQCNIESEDNYKSKPIHYACQFGHIDIVKMLIDEKCQIESKDGYGHTPLDLANLKGHNDIVELIINEISLKKKHSLTLEAIMSNDSITFGELYTPGILTTTDGASGQSWLELALKKGAYNVLEWFLYNPIDQSEISYIKNITENESENSSVQLWKEVLLYKCIRDHNEDNFQFLCCANVVNAQRKIIPSSFLEVAAEHGNFFFVSEILKKCIWESKTWEKARKIAAEKGHIQMEKLISDRESLLKYRHKANLSILHTAVCDNDPEMVQYILDSALVDPNQNHEILGTALALAIALCHESCVKVLHRLGVDCNTQNRYLQSPLLDAFSNGMIEHCQYLIDSAININKRGFMRQTVLHSAVMRGCEDLCNQLMEKGADCNLYMKFLQRSEIKDPLSITKLENSLTLCVKNNKTIYPCFLGALDQNAVNSCDAEGNSLLHLCVNLLETKICSTLIEAGANVDAINKKGHTPLSELLSQLDKKEFDEDETFNKNMSQLLKSLVIKGNHVDERVLYHLARFNDISDFDCLLSIEITNQKIFENGETLLTGLLKEGKFEFCQKVIQSEINKKKYTNFKNQKNETPLQVAIETESMDIIQDLIFESKNLNNEDNRGLTALMQLFEKISTTNEKSQYSSFLNAIKMIIKEGGDIYHKTSEGINIVELCSREDARKEIEMFQNKQQKNIVAINEKIDDKVFVNNCGICLNTEVDTVFQCGHTICHACCEKLLRCPFCNYEPLRPMRIYFN